MNDQDKRNALFSRLVDTLILLSRECPCPACAEGIGHDDECWLWKLIREAQPLVPKEKT